MKAPIRWTVALGLGAAVALALAAKGTGDSNKAKTSQRSMAAAAALLEMYADEHLEYPSSGGALVPLTTLGQAIGLPAPSGQLVKDAWGGHVRYWSDGASYMLVSFGEDGEPQFDYQGSAAPYEPVTRGVLTTNPQQDIVLVCGAIWQGPVLGDRTRSANTMADMRSVGTAIEEYSIDNNFYPGSGAQLVDLATVEPHLSPSYIKNLPSDDGWGQPLRYWSDHQGYTVLSTGADGLADAPYESWTAEDFLSYSPGVVLEPRLDVLFTNGDFVQSHAGATKGDCP